MVTLKTKEKYANLFPFPVKEVYESMKADIKENGQKVPIDHNRKGYILDGYTRYKITKELKLKPLTELREFDTEVEEIEFILSMNNQRRDLTSPQKFLAFEDYRQELLKLNKEHSKSADREKPSPHGQSATVIAKKAGVSMATAERMIYIINNGTKEDIDKLKDGGVLWDIFTNVKARNRIKKDRILEYTKNENNTKNEENLDSIFHPPNPVKHKQRMVCPECGGTGHIYI